MTLTIEEFDQIEAYLSNRLRTMERQTFELKLNTNPELKEEVALQQQLRLGLTALAIEKKLMSSRKKFDSEENIAESTSPKVVPLLADKRSLTQKWLIAASVTVVLGSGLFYKNQYYISTAGRSMAAEEISYKSAPFVTPDHSYSTDRKRLLAQRAEWYFALAMIQKGDKQKAKRTLHRISQTPEHAYKAKAKVLLGKL